MFITRFYFISYPLIFKNEHCKIVELIILSCSQENLQIKCGLHYDLTEFENERSTFHNIGNGFGNVNRSNSHPLLRYTSNGRKKCYHFWSVLVQTTYHLVQSHSFRRKQTQGMIVLDECFLLALRIDY